MRLEDNYAIQDERSGRSRFGLWGGKRKGAGRRGSDVVAHAAGVPHVTRAVLAQRFPVHVTWRMDKQRLEPANAALLWRRMSARDVRGRVDASDFGSCITRCMGNHVHLHRRGAESRKRCRAGCKGSAIRIARALNRVMKRQRARARRSLSRAHLAHAVGGAARARVPIAECAAALRRRWARSVYVVGGGDRAGYVFDAEAVLAGRERGGDDRERAFVAVRRVEVAAVEFFVRVGDAVAAPAWTAS